MGGGRLSLFSRLPIFRSQSPFVFALPSPKARQGAAGAEGRHCQEHMGGNGGGRAGSGTAQRLWNARHPGHPRLLRLMAPARSQEQPGSLPGERKRLPAASPSLPSAGVQKPSLRLPFSARAQAEKPPFPPGHPLLPSLAALCRLPRATLRRHTSSPLTSAPETFSHHHLILKGSSG